ncbi:hypothetical protein [Dongia sp.]|uniref:hypothetical protein n=1 Tax=Dongia sp. TaxID=1977262 RepID=UPI0035B0FC4A
MRAFQPTRRGRPPKRGRGEAANDNEPDRGTAEARAQRAQMAQGARLEATAHPLDLLLAHALIDAGQHRAGMRYAGLYRRLVGRTDVSYQRLYEGLAGRMGRETGDGPENVEEGADRQQIFRAAQAALRAEGAVVAGIIERLAVFGAFPDWLLAKTAIAQRERALLARGLDALARGFRNA